MLPGSTGEHMRFRSFATGAALTLFVVALAACSDEGDSGSSDSGDDETTQVAASPGCDGGTGVEGEATLEHDGRTRTYLVHLPEGYDPSTPAPMTFNLHGMTSNIAQQDAYTQMPERAGERGYIVVTPQGELMEAGIPGVTFWNFFLAEVSIPGEDGEMTTVESGAIGADDIGFLTELTDLILDELCVDEDRVFSTGMSNGAGMSTILACELDGRIKAVGPVTGVNFTEVCSGDDPVSVIAFHGDEDGVVAYEGNNLAGFQLGNPSVPDRMAQWAEHNGCESEPDVEDRGDGVVITRWDCPDDLEVELWTLQGWGHRWPQGQGAGPAGLETSEMILDFFDRTSGS